MLSVVEERLKAETIRLDNFASCSGVVKKQNTYPTIQSPETIILDNMAESTQHARRSARTSSL